MIFVICIYIYLHMYLCIPINQPVKWNVITVWNPRTVFLGKQKQNCGTLLLGGKFDQDPSERQGFLEAHGAPHRWIVGGGHIIRQ